ncbi:aminotransferase A [Pseudalkalibacillus hwajinpoensis]|uniref:aminotransferase A n=1 Tax=Guptibacillus hwajinpoensis TaxID=208199 RepID=UPI001CD399FA|nr:aminotransferase A [Pseudalkalibacillus hwajinpoensis]MCA0990347.1 aminotransferase A [Pseudalkalibacillus hwajinpoensis]
MEHLLNPRVNNIEISGIRTFFNMVADYENMISLTIGQPDFETPVHIKEAAQMAIDQNKTTYTHNAGILELRKAASHFLKTKYNLTYKPETEVITTSGASQAIDVTLRTLLTEGDEVILPGPVYPGYEPIITLCGAVPVHVDTTENGFKLSRSLVESALTERTKCIILPSPSNPTGVAMSAAELEDLAALLEDKNIFVLSDEIYSELTFSGDHASIAQFASMREKTIVINGLSKSHAMTGWRIGFLFAPEALAKHILKVHQYNVSCASSVSQYAALEALDNGLDDPIEMRTEYSKRMNYVFDRLVGMGLSPIKPDGAFYILPSIKQFGLTSFDFAMKLAKEGNVAVVPGSAFSTFGEGYVRISFAYNLDVLKEGMDRLERFLSTL